MASIRIKRSMSPDGKIDSVTVELDIEAELTDTQAVLDAIGITDAYAKYVNSKAPAPRAASASGAPGTTMTLIGVPQAVYPGEPSRTGKMGPGAIIINGEKVKSFDASYIEAARNAKLSGQSITVTYARNEKWNSNDVKSLGVTA